MIVIETQVAGLSELQTTLDRMPDTLRERLRALLPQAGEEIRAAASALVPHSPRRSSASKKYGPLHSKIKARLFEKGDTLTETVSIGRAFYGVFIERGLDTMRKPARRRGVVGVRAIRHKDGRVSFAAKRGLLKRPGGAATPFHLPAHPFMAPAFLPRREAIMAKIREAVFTVAE